MKNIRVGIIGFGFIGKVHAYGYREMPLFYDPLPFRNVIAKVCTAHEESARHAVEQLGGDVVPVTDFREITEDPDIDVVDVSSPNSAHLEALLSAIKHGKHIFCEKPLTVTLDEALKVQSALGGYSGISQMTLIYRFYPCVLRAKQLIEEGRIGDVLEFHASFLHSGSVDPGAPFTFKLANGVVADLGSHILDLVQSLIGRIATVQARTRIAFPMRPVARGASEMTKVTGEDGMYCLATLENGAIGTIIASKIATGTEDEITLEIRGTKGALRLEPMNLQQLFYYDQNADASPIGGFRGWTAIDCGQRYDKPAGFPTPKAVMGWLRGHVHCLYNFLDGVYRNAPVHPDLSDGVALQRLMTAVKDSAANGGSARDVF